MNLKDKSQAVLALYQELGAEAKSFASEGKLGCYSGCGLCCANPKIPASPLEFLPLAFELYEKGAADATLRIIEENPSANCVLFRAQDPQGNQGFCSNYQNRGLICRLFGSAARRNKVGQKELIICKKLKEGKPHEFLETTQKINQDLEIPMAMAYYTQARDIDESLSEEFPINEAIGRSIELVLRFKYYEEGEKATEF